MLKAAKGIFHWLMAFTISRSFGRKPVICAKHGTG